MSRASDSLDTRGIETLLADLVRVPSVNPTIAPDEHGDERAVAALACEWLNARGVRAWTEDAAPGRPNAVAEVVGGEGPTLVLCAHLDTVGTLGMDAPFEPRVEGGRMYGRGTYDMKGGVAACMAAAEALSRKPFGGTLLLALVADEEYASVGAEAFVKRHRADACILTEASEGNLVLAHRGFIWADVVVHGHAAHGSRWDLGDSANTKMGHVLVALDRYDRDVLRARRHEPVGPASMHAALLAGGTGLSTYAPECRLTIERRTLPGEAVEAVMDELRAVVRSVDPTAEVTMRIARPPMTCESASPIAVAVRGAVTRVTGTAPAEVGVAYWMDSAIFDEAGIPTVDYGPTGAGAHETVEWVDLESVVTTARVLVESARAFTGAASL